jgi:aspartyl-tRNA(Asn)/glutamyl-tRNA(Gln) amidotransferase subunit C
MAIDRAEAARIAALARLAIPAEELDTVATQLSQVLELAATLDRLDLEGCEPMAFAPADAPLRADEPDGRTLPAGAATQMAPEGDEFFFLVPPVVENLEP